MADSVRVNLDLDVVFRDANKTDQVIGGIRQRAQKVADAARRIDQRENGGKSNFKIEDGHLPSNGRAFSRVISDETAEYGKQGSVRRSILRRASGGATRP